MAGSVKHSTPSVNPEAPVPPVLRFSKSIVRDIFRAVCKDIQSMRRTCAGVVLFLWLMAAWFCQAAEDQHVVLITIDGCPARMFWDAKTPIPRIRQLAADGVAAEGLRISNPTLTWPNHTTLVTGVQAASHSVLYNGILVREGPGQPVKVDPKRGKAELVAVPTLYDGLHKAGLRTAAINWPCTRDSTSLDDDFPDVPDSVLHTTPRLRQELVAQHILPDDQEKTFRALTGPGRDEVWTKAACHLIRTAVRIFSCSIC